MGALTNQSSLQSAHTCKVHIAVVVEGSFESRVAYLHIAAALGGL